MANLNLSQFTEKTLVADADWVFVWDTAGAISKKVSRNSLLNSGTLATSAPVTISQTWDAGTNVMTALKVVATDTASGATSNLLELWAGSTPALNFRVNKNGTTQIGSAGSRPVLFDANSGLGINRADVSLTAASIYLGNFGSVSRITIVSGGTIGWGSSSGDVSGGNAIPDTVLLRDGAANTLALRNGAAAQTFNVYGTSSSSNTVYERMFAKYNGTDLAFQIGTETVSATLRPLDFVTGGTRRMTIGTTGNVGIGTTAPAAKLTIITPFNNYPTNTNPVLSLRQSTDNTFGFDWIQDGQNTGDLHLHRVNNSASNHVLTITRGSGNVGIGTTSPSSKLHVAETWNASGTTFTAAKVDVTDTASASVSKLLDLQVGGVSKFSVGKTGIVSAASDFFGTYIYSGTAPTAGIFPNTVFAGSGGVIGFASAATFGGVVDTTFVRDGEADHIAMRRSTNGQKFSVYGTYPGAAWERFTITAPTSGNVLLGTYKGTGGIARGLEFQTDGVTRMSVGAAGSFSFSNNGTTDLSSGIGAWYLTTTGVQIANGGSFRWNGDVGISRNASGVAEINSTTVGTFRDLRVRSVIQQPPDSITPASNGDYVVEATNNTTLTFRLKGSDGVVRSATLTLAP